MIVITVICLHILGTYSITVPPVWSRNGDVTPLPANSELFKYQSFYPSDTTPTRHINKLQYRPPNNQQFFVYHPQPTELNKPTPESYQIVHFDNQKDVLIKQPITEISAPKNVEESEHEVPREVPTKPIYPGEGQWAKYGQKHHPYIHQTKEQPAEEPEDPPEGYETFQRGEEQFQRAKNNFPPSKITTSESSPSEIGFIPEKLYTQVRRTESEKHLPRSAIDPEEEENAARLREVIKDSKIHTVYTEEGYEDTAYDHAGHEKNAENHEGHEKSADDQSGSTGKGSGGGRRRYSGEGGKRRGSNNERRRHENNQRLKNEDYSNSKAYKKHDVESAGSNNHGVLTIPLKHVKKVTLKNGKNEDIDMDVYTEVKYTPGKKKHKYVKITPSVKQLETEKPLKRVKRYDKDKLSKKYIRKRPTYYWKKIKTTTSERPLMSNRRQFEAAFKTHRKPQNIEELEIEEPIEKVSTTTVKTTVSTTQNPVNNTAESMSSISKPEEFLHPDLLNPELTTRMSKPSPPKALPVKIKKFKVKRQKRYTNDFPNLNVDLTEFTDVEKLTVPTQPPDLTHLKYPYYNLPVSEELNENSPLRYAEDMKNIPKKIENELSFYESREHIVCPEIPSNVNPIPERVTNQEEGEETNKMADAPDLPRLTGLGDKIDCLKVKYFGEDPLDSPFFQEETIEDPVPFFEIKKQENIKKISPDFIISTPMDKNTIKRELKIKILEPIVVLDEELIESATVNPIHQNTEAVLKPPYTLTEMMTMNQEKIMKMNPKSIYDQITILEQDDEKTSEKDSDPPSEKFVIIYDNQDAAKNLEKTNATRPEKIVSSTVKPQETVKKPQIRKRPVNIIRKLAAKTIKKPQPKITSTTSSTTTEAPTTTEVPTTTTTTQQPTTTIKTIQKPPQTLSRRPVVRTNNWQSANRGIAAFYNIFDISRFLPKVPNHRIITSEVQYKDFIKPSEQMKVYSDVLQSINNEKENKDAADTKPVAVTVSVPKDEQQKEETPQKPQKEEIIGMLPPSGDAPYKTINQETEMTPQSSKQINYYYFIGMKPPNQVRHIISKRDTSKYSKISKKFSKTSKSEKKSKIEEIEDLMMEESRFSPNVIRRHRSKRENPPAQRKPKVYTEIVRQRPSRPVEDPEEEEEDLNPRKRIYEFGKSTTTPRPQIEDLKEVEEPEEFEEIVTEPTTTPKPRIYPVEANSKNSTIAEYIFFIEKLHDKWAKEDATSTTTTTETTVVTQTTAESVNERRGEPAYLQIINQLHEVREEVDATTTTTSTTPVPSTSDAVPIKNSNPFILDTFMSELNSMKAKLDPDNTAEGTSHETARNRNYSTRFKTNIDTSKYKTIERAPVNVRHNLSSRYNSDDQELPLHKEKTTQTPMIIAIITKPQTNEPIVETSTGIPDSIKEETTNKEPELETPSTTVKPRQRGRPRRPSTYTSTTPRPSTTNPIFRRRRPSRITTTTQATTTKSDFYSNRRRTRKPLPISSTTENIVVVTPVSTFNKEEDSQEDEEPKKQRRFQKVQERHVMSEVTLTRFFEPDSEEQDDTSEESKKHQYEVIGPLTNTDTLHGGNYKHEDELTTLPLFTDPNLAENVNQLKEASTEKTQASNSLLTQEEIAEKVAQKPVHSKVSLYPNMARMVNRLAEMKQETTTEDDQTEKPTFIKDPSRRMYYYAKL